MPTFQIGPGFPLSDLLVMQSDLRHWDDLKSMIAYVQKGGFWTPEYLSEYAKEKGLDRISPIIALSRFEDGSIFLHDGHHRCVATWLGGRDYLRSDEYTRSDWTYDDYLEIAPHNGWYTPFDPRTHVRTADFGAFKKEARIRFNQDPMEAVDWLYEHMGDFRTPRTLSYLPELAANIQAQKRLVHR